MAPRAWRIILICQHCEASLVVKRGDLPTRCPFCKEGGYWRVATDGELTLFDRKFLKTSRIDPDG